MCVCMCVSVVWWILELSAGVICGLSINTRLGTVYILLALLACFSSRAISGLLTPFCSECSRTRERKRACVGETLLRREYRAIVCSQLFQL